MGVKVTFLMMAYNAEEYIEKAVRSILNQTISDINLYVRENGSTDSTRQILKRISAEDDRLIVLTNEVNGVMDDGRHVFDYGWWFPVDGCLGEYLSIVDSDDYIENDFAETLYNAAKENDCDVIFAGNNFIENGLKVGKRNAPAINVNNISEIGNAFPEVYNCFRTWWGKLFKKEIFVEQYAKAWFAVRPLWWTVDTIIMMNYLGFCKHIRGVDRHLYNMTLRSNSTYKTRTLVAGRINEAYTLLFVTKKLLEDNGIHTKENLDFIEDIHWSYIRESIENAVVEDETDAKKAIEFLEDALHDDVVKTYSERRFEILFFQMKKLIDDSLIKLNAEDRFKSYICRLCAFVNIVYDNSNYDLAYLLIFGVLFDINNDTLFGDNLLSLPLGAKTPAIEFLLSFHQQIRKGWHYHPEKFVACIEEKEKSSETDDKVNQMMILWKSGDHDGACELSSEILKDSKFNIKAIVCRMYYLKEIGELEEERLLYYSVLPIWKTKLDKIMEDFD